MRGPAHASSKQYIRNTCAALGEHQAGIAAVDAGAQHAERAVDDFVGIQPYGLIAVLQCGEVERRQVMPGGGHSQACILTLPLKVDKN